MVSDAHFKTSPNPSLARRGDDPCPPYKGGPQGVLRPILIIAITLLFAFTSGCARFPTTPVSPTGKRLIITMTVAGEINPSYYYYIAFDTSGTATPGPLPVVGRPWGNGWGTGNITDYVLYDQLQPQGYGLYRIPAGTQLLGKEYNGAPIYFISPPDGSNKLQFTISIDQLATATLPAADIDQININFITTDKVPLDDNYPGPKYYDGLGDLGNDFLSISVETNQTYSNTQTPIEQTGDVVIPDLDIIDWTIEVQGD